MLCPGAKCLSGHHLALETSRGSWLPFLYQTRTILRRSYAADAFGEVQHVEQKRTQRSLDDRRPLRRKRMNTAGRPFKSGIPSDNSQGRDDTRSLAGEDARRSMNARGPRYDERDGTRPQLEHVPFEGSAGSGNILQKLEGSTMTPREMEVFKRLLSKTAEAQTMDIGQVAQREDSTGRAKGTFRARPEFPQPLRPLVEEAKELRALNILDASSKKQEQRGSVGEQLSAGAKEFLTQTRKAMDAAKSEAVLWDILQTKVFQKVESLQLESRQRPSNAMMRDLNILTATLPSLLLHFMTTVANSFPQSSLGVMLVPALKKRGPSAFALGATTGLFNHHMEFLYRQYSDLDAIATTLAEMDKNVYNFNWDTGALLTSIFEAADAASTDKAGPATKALWAMDRKQRALEKLRAWEKVVVERLNADALRRANEKQLPDDDAEESDDEEIALQSV